MENIIAELFSSMAHDLAFNEMPRNPENMLSWLNTKYLRTLDTIEFSEGPAMPKLIAIKQMIDALSYQPS